MECLCVRFVKIQNLMFLSGFECDLRLYECLILNWWDCLLSQPPEAGIVFHSVIIGVTVGSTGGNEFIPLLIAINMHQACEGLGLATRISLLATRTRVHYLLYFAFCITTPLGMAIGTGIRQRYNASDRNTLLTLGVLNSISAGILIYSALVQLMAGDFLYNRSMLSASLKRCLSALAAFVLGAIAMVS